MADQKITQLTEETAPVSSDLTVIVDDPSGSPTTKKTTLENLSKGIVVANMPDFLDEDDMSSDSASSVASQQSIKAYVDNNPYGGWLTTGISGVTVTRASIDDPTVVLTFAADVTDYIWKGSRLKLTEGGTTHYMIVSADPVYSDPNTTVTCLMEIDTTTPTQAADPVDSGTITDVAYAPPKTYPKGFPMAKQSWTVKVQNATDVEQTTPSGTTWYNLGSINLSIPIGDWEIGYFVVVHVAGSSNLLAGYTTLSDANNTEDTEMTQVTASTTTHLFGSHSINKRETVTTKKTKYLNARRGGSALTYIRFSGAQSATIIRATSTLL